MTLLAKRPGFRGDGPDARGGGVALRRPVLIAALVSCLLHAGLAALLLFGRVRPPAPPEPKQLGTIEFVRVQQQGKVASATTDPVAPAPRPPTPAAQASAARASNAQAAQVQAPSPAPDQARAKTPAELPLPQQVAKAEAAPPKPATSAQPQPAAPPSRQTKDKAPVFDLSGTDSDYNAIAFGAQIIPPSQDSHFRNNPPRYPKEAELRHESGTVVLLIHVSPDGLTAGVEVAESSGVEVLDSAAMAAVRAWHFRPAMKDGMPVSFDMPFRFVFEPD